MDTNFTGDGVDPCIFARKANYSYLLNSAVERRSSSIRYTFSLWARLLIMVPTCYSLDCKTIHLSVKVLENND